MADSLVDKLDTEKPIYKLKEKIMHKLKHLVLKNKNRRLSSIKMHFKIRIELRLVEKD